jgi:XRN 5'-3' exonuclease N-terminus
MYACTFLFFMIYLRLFHELLSSYIFHELFSLLFSSYCSDGVAPRAKMNQQRSRRFRSAKEAREKAAIEDKVRADLASTNPDMVSKSGGGPKEMDSNVITPGSPFMARVTEALRFYAANRVSNYKAWENVCVIFVLWCVCVCVCVCVYSYVVVVVVSVSHSGMFVSVRSGVVFFSR